MRSSSASTAPPSSWSGSACAELDSPYADPVDAVCLTLGELPAADRDRVGNLVAGGPPSELVGLEPFAPPEVMPTAEAPR